MRFNDHFRLKDQHAFLSASKGSWVNYDDEKVMGAWASRNAAAKGTRLHHLAHLLIFEGVKLPRSTKTLNRYVNDGIGFRMSSEQILFGSEYAFGTADCISFHDNILRISDLKTGIREVGERQLEIYAVFFCLEYDIDPFTIDEIQLRIYQNDEVRLYIADPVDIKLWMEKVRYITEYINRYEREINL